MLTYSSFNEYNKRSVCSMNPIVYNIVKMNELYSNDDRINYYMNMLQIYNYQTFDIGTDDLLSSIPWMFEQVQPFPLAQLKTNGNVLVLGGQMDAQTPKENSITLNNLLLNNGVNSTLLIGINWGHGIIGYTSPYDNYCGIDVISQFINDIPMKTSCLEMSIYPTFSQGTYLTYPIETPTSTPTPVAQSTIELNQSAVIGLSIVFAFTMIALVAHIYYIYYLRKNKIIVNQIDHINLN